MRRKKLSYLRCSWNLDRNVLIPGTPDLCAQVGEFDGQNRQSKQNIFFLETSGEACLTARQACSVESAARINPDATISVHMEINALSEKGEKKTLRAGQRRNCAVTDRLFHDWKNVKLIRESLLDHLKNTPLWRLQQKGLLDKSSYSLTHRSDAVRVAMLWKYGGLYLDLDCLVFRPLYCLHNTAGLVDFLPNWVENGVITFQAGHPFLEFLMKYMVFSFKPDEYISLGPATLTDAIKYFCDRSELPADEKFTCRNSSITLQPPQSFYAISNRRQNAFYHAEADLADLEEFRFSYLSHIYDAGKGRTVPSGSLYALLAQQFCPVTYHLASGDNEL